MRRFMVGMAFVIGLAGCNTSSTPLTSSAPTPGQRPGSSAASSSTTGAAVAQEEMKEDAGASGQSGKQEPGEDTDAPAGTPLDQAMKFAQDGEFEKAAGVLKKALAENAQDRQLAGILLQVSQAQSIQVLGEKGEKEAGPMFIETAALARKFMADFQPLEDGEKAIVGQSLYNGACFECKVGKLEDALKSLGDAFSAGFSDLAQLDKDEDLVALRERADFKEFRAEQEKKIVEAARAEAAENLAKFESFPFDFKLTDVEGKERKLADYKGKVLIVDIWGTWCPPCRMEIPHFIDLLAKYKEQGLEIVGINYEDGSPEEIRETVKKFIEENKMTYTCVVGDDATRDQVPNFEGFPTTLFIDRTGKVRFKEVGYRPLVALDSVVSALLAETAPAAEEAPKASE
ncbi:MAG: TlpA disulfide reductase family protein [Pirellulales bacterium]